MTSLTPAELAGLRREYQRHSLSERDVDPDPLRQFSRWFDEAVAAAVDDPNAMTLATAGPDGTPSARIVLLKALDPRGFVFFTNYESRKGKELASRPDAALLFYWHALERQVRVEGRVERLPADENSSYFASRPRSSRIASWASRQSAPIDSREALEEEFAKRSLEFNASDVPLPPFWGGFRLIPVRVEFWQGRENRLHDRIVYERRSGGWSLVRLAP